MGVEASPVQSWQLGHPKGSSQHIPAAWVWEIVIFAKLVTVLNDVHRYRLHSIYSASTRFNSFNSCSASCFSNVRLSQIAIACRSGWSWLADWFPIAVCQDVLQALDNFTPQVRTGRIKSSEYADTCAVNICACKSLAVFRWFSPKPNEIHGLFSQVPCLGFCPSSDEFLLSPFSKERIGGVQPIECSLGPPAGPQLIYKYRNPWSQISQSE